MNGRVSADRRRRKSRNAIFVIVLLALVADVVLAARYLRYRDETRRLRAGMTRAQLARADAVLDAEQHRWRIEFELIRRQARGDKQLHLAVNVDSGHMILERDGVVLREIPVRLGQERFRGPQGDSIISVQSLGQRTVVRMLDANDSWDVPADVFRDRGVEIPGDRRIAGALGRDAILLTAGTVIYAVPAKGPLADSSYVLPGSVQVSAADLEALSASIRRGMSVYFYR